jgi:hypothetical protein
MNTKPSRPSSHPYIVWLSRKLADPTLAAHTTPQHIRHEWTTLMHAKPSRATNQRAALSSPRAALPTRTHHPVPVWADFQDTTSLPPSN